MARPQAPADVFFAAGAPWYLTLFGRDSLWAARLRAARQPRPGPRHPAGAGRAAGDHHRRRAGRSSPARSCTSCGAGPSPWATMSLPPLYYGTIDATPLWVCLLHDAWRAGLPEAEVRRAAARARGRARLAADRLRRRRRRLRRVPRRQRARPGQPGLEGLRRLGPLPRRPDRRGAGRAVRGAGLRARGRRLGRRAAGRPSTVRAASGCAAGPRALAERFRAAFWWARARSRYPALALDGHGARVDALTSNIGHLLGTGLLDAEEERLVARHVAGAGSGLRARAADHVDRRRGVTPRSATTAARSGRTTRPIVIAGLARAGLAEHASGLVEGLLRASVAFDQRLPELWSGEGRPVPYPAACRPQAWSAAAAVVVASALGAAGSR